MVTDTFLENTPAFPVYAKADGMSLRDYFAAKAMQGIVTRVGCLDKVDDLVGAAYEIADAMLEERDKHR